MAYPVKPTKKSAWTDGNINFATVTQEPTASKKEAGWLIGERPPREYMNWLFYNIGHEWIEYLEGTTDELKTLAGGLTQNFDAIVGSGAEATHADLATALAAASSGWSILVKDSENVAAKIQVPAGKDNIRIYFKPGVTLSDNGAGTGLEILSDGCRIIDGRFAGFTTEAIKIDAGASYTMLRDIRFSGNTAEITDAGASTSSTGHIVE